MYTNTYQPNILGENDLLYDEPIMYIALTFLKKLGITFRVSSRSYLTSKLLEEVKPIFSLHIQQMADVLAFTGEKIVKKIGLRVLPLGTL